MSGQWLNLLSAQTGHLLFVKSSGFIIMVSVIFIVFIEYLLRIRFNVSEVAYYLLYWAILSAMFSALTIFSWAEHHTEEERLFIEAFIAGIIAGFLIALYKILAYHEIWVVFNLIAEPLRTALFGLLIVWFVARVEPTTSGKEISLLNS